MAAALTINQLKYDNMKSLFLHLAAVAVLLPCLLIVSEGDFVYNIIGAAYIILLCVLSGTTIGKKVLRLYYREILRLESLM